MSRFLERLDSGPPIVADGGMGALLASAVDRLRCPEEANLKAPEAVIDVHLGYIRAGAELIETNTFGASRAKLAQYFLEDEFERINAAAVKLAREAREISGKELLIAGAIGPGGDYAEQALVLEGRGVELFFVEYFAEFAAQARTLGARIIGGCCGTTPAQIAAISTAITANAAPASPLLVRERNRATSAGAG